MTKTQYILSTLDSVAPALTHPVTPIYGNRLGDVLIGVSEWCAPPHLSVLAHCLTMQRPLVSSLLVAPWLPSVSRTLLSNIQLCF